MDAFGDRLNAGHGAKSFHGIVDMPVNTAFRNIQNLTNFKRALAGSAPRQALQLSLRQ